MEIMRRVGSRGVLAFHRENWNSFWTRNVLPSLRVSPTIAVVVALPQLAKNTAWKLR
jgi:hypothetical protein